MKRKKKYERLGLGSAGFRKCLYLVFLIYFLCFLLAILKVFPLLLTIPFI